MTKARGNAPCSPRSFTLAEGRRPYSEKTATASI
ncbi:MAG: hypothetical protein JWO26_1610, partial [Rhodospirillales bacterium]|nr:hypothetical protein [Rhodospirillales bacterium]